MKPFKIIVLLLFCTIILSMIYNRFFLDLYFVRETIFVIGILIFLLFQKNRYISMLGLILYFYGIYHILFVDSDFNSPSAYNFASPLASTFSYYHLKMVSGIVPLIPIIYYSTSIVLVLIRLSKQWKGGSEIEKCVKLFAIISKN